MSLNARHKTFRALHEQGCFVIPNPWDVGSARYLQHLGFPALATTSAGFAFSQGLPDSDDVDVAARDRNLAYIASIAEAVDLPVSADFMSGYGAEPEDVAESVTRCVATGVAGLSIEDSTGDSASPLYDLPVAIERVRAARQAIDGSGADVLSPREPSAITSVTGIRFGRAFDVFRHTPLPAPTCSSLLARKLRWRSRRSSRPLRRSR